ncbi:MAG: GreA/GreB family elongation factor [Nitrospinota bacterium]
MKRAIIEKLEVELEQLDYELKVTLPKELKIAADHGDLSENAEYDAAKERKRFVESRISHLQKRISEILSVNLDAISEDTVGLGSEVELENLDDGQIVKYSFVFPEEVDPERGKISLASPVGKALIGKEEGDEAIITTPREKKHFEIIKLKTIHDLRKEKSSTN